MDRYQALGEARPLGEALVSVLLILNDHRHSLHELPATYVTLPMATRAERNQVLRFIPAKSAPGRHVMNLQILHCATVLAAPTISLEYLISDQDVFFWIEFKSRLPTGYAH
jgi:hypothetical protein